MKFKVNTEDFENYQKLGTILMAPGFNQDHVNIPGVLIYSRLKLVCFYLVVLI